MKAKMRAGFASINLHRMSGKKNNCHETFFGEKQWEKTVFAAAPYKTAATKSLLCLFDKQRKHAKSLFGTSKYQKPEIALKG